MAERNTPTRNENVADCYVVRCPDVLDVRVASRPELNGSRPVDTSGHIGIGNERMRVEGETTPEVARRIALIAGVPPSAVQVRIANYRSQQVYLFGPGIGLQRAVAFQGPETVVDLLQRTGGITAGAEPQDAYLVRPRVADDQPPEVFHVNLHGILLKKDQQTNIRVQPFDQVFVGETRRASLLKCMPPWLRPFYESLCGFDRESPMRSTTPP